MKKRSSSGKKSSRSSYSKRTGGKRGGKRS